MAQFLIGDQVTCKLDDGANAFTDTDFESDDGLVAYLRDSDGATGPVPTIAKTPFDTAPSATTTFEPYGALGNKVGAFGDPTGISSTDNSLVYTDGANVIVSGIVAVTIPGTGSTTVGEQLGYVETVPSAPTTDGLQSVSSGGKGRIVARNGQTVYWDIRAK